ncbi:cag [Calliopsis andreniformis]|uniref:cag n=1 Tax=Calliopsis andreniformis TaxID=337506 RepID=UPI003FCE9467
MSGKRKKVIVTMEKKLEALSRIDKGEPLRRVAIDLGVGVSTVSDWKKNREEIEDFCAKMLSRDCLGNRGTTKKAKNVILDDALYVWYIEKRENGVPISGPILRKKALTLNKKLGGDPTFSASVGWLGRWKARHGIRLAVSGDSFIGDSSAHDNLDHQLLLDNDIVTVCLSTDNTEKTENSLDNECHQESTKLHHTETVEMLEKLIAYFEYQSDTSENELETLKHLRDRVSNKCVFTLKKEKEEINDFVQ